MLHSCLPLSLRNAQDLRFEREVDNFRENSQPHSGDMGADGEQPKKKPNPKLIDLLSSRDGAL